MGDARLRLEFINWDGLSDNDQQILNEALNNGSSCVELPWQNEEDCLDTHTSLPEQPGLPSCVGTLDPEATLATPLQETFEMQQVFLRPQVYQPAQYSPGHHHQPVINPEHNPPRRNSWLPYSSQRINSARPSQRWSQCMVGNYCSYGGPVYRRHCGAAPVMDASQMVCDFTEQHQPQPTLPLEGIGKRPPGRRTHHRNKGMHHNTRPEMTANPPAVEVLDRMGEPVRHMPLTYAAGQSGYSYSFPQPLYYMCVQTAQPFYPAQGHHPLSFVTAMVSPQPPPHVAMAVPSTLAGEPVTVAHYAEPPGLSPSKEEMASPVTTSTSEPSPAVLDDMEAAELLASGVSSEADGALHEITEPASPLPTAYPSNVPEAAVPVEQTRAVTALEESATTPRVVNGSGLAKRCWADLFKKGSSEVEGGNKRQSVVPFAHDGVASDCEDEVRPCRPSVPESVDTSLGRALHKFTVDHTPPLIQPRGLENGKNWCYINANLQALLACPAFYNLLYSLPLVPGMPGSNATPFLECLIYFLQSYAIPMVRETSGKKGELVVGTAYDPEKFRDLLMKIKPDCKKGKQEDAEEFLSFMLNGLHDEMVSSMRSVSNGLNGQCNGEAQPPVEHVEDDDDDDGAWKTVIHRNRHQVTRSAEYLPSPLMDIFGGEMRSSVTADGETSASLQPFFTLQLDIQDGVKTVEDALLHLAAEEKVQNYHSSKSNKEVDALRKTTLEKLPLVLILHLKRFVYDKNGGCKKLMNAIHIPHQLQLDRKLVPSTERWSNMQRSYALFAVLSHSGERTDKGHYVTDAFHPAGRTWFRCDDDNVTPIAQGDLLRFENSSLVPYLLFYRRMDTDHQAR